MALTELDAKSALLVIDLQNGIVALPTAHPAPEIVLRAAELTAAFRAENLPVVLVNVDALPPGRTEVSRHFSFPPGWTDFVPELHRQSGDHVVTKRSAGAFMHTGLAEYLREAGVTQLVIAGISTSMGVESTARQGFELGFNVTLVTDAMTDTDMACHQHSVARIFPRLGETGTAAEVMELLRKRRP
jgi:nicotinamidase-related amidase